MPSLPNAFLFTSLTFLSAAGFGGRLVAGEMPAADRLIFHGGVSGLFDAEKPPAFATEYRFGRKWIGLQPWLSAGWATDGATLFGGGVTRAFALDSRWEAVLGFGPGYYDRHEGQDLGNHLEFYSFAELSCELRAGHRVLLRLGHISNGSLGDSNPGTELLTLGYSVSLP